MRKLLVGGLALALSTTVVAQGTSVPRAYERWVVQVLDKLGALEVDCPPVAPAAAGSSRVCAEVSTSPALFRSMWDLYGPDEAEKLGITLEVRRAWKTLNDGAFDKIYRHGDQWFSILYFPKTQFSGLISIYFVAPRT